MALKPFPFRPARPLRFRQALLRMRLQQTIQTIDSGLWRSGAAGPQGRMPDYERAIQEDESFGDSE